MMWFAAERCLSEIRADEPYLIGDESRIACEMKLNGLPARSLVCCASLATCCCRPTPCWSLTIPTARLFNSTELTAFCPVGTCLFAPLWRFAADQLPAGLPQFLRPASSTQQS